MIDNIKTQMRKGVLEYCTLEILSRREAYPTEILDLLKQAGLVVMEGTLYPLLTRMKNSGLLSYRWQESPSGPPRKYYKVTDDGQSLINDLEGEWSVIENTVKAIREN